MSTRKSSAHDPALALKAVEQELLRPPCSTDPQMQRVREARLGSPALVVSPEGEAAYWMIPILAGAKACGFAQVSTANRVMAISTLGAGPDDRKSWLSASFFSKPPAAALREIREKHPELAKAEVTLSYDGSPARWAWRVSAPGASVEAYVSGAGWYVRPVSAARRTDFEG